MGFLGWIVLGLLAGAIAKLIMPGDDPGGIIVTMLIGIVGALIGGYLGSLFFGTGLQNFWSFQTWIVAIIGSLILLGIYRLVVGRRAVGRT
ncbi:MAG TPA: GlsB/YeaQ/YmgE family stress response membrane protein [Pseudonocardiaceae bacterium]